MMPIWRKKNDSNIWKGICSAWQDVERNSIWRVGNGSKINFWEHNWVSTAGCLNQYTLQVSETNNSNISLNDFLLVSRDWDANKLRTWLPEELVEKIIAMTPPSPWKDDDQLAWNLSSDGTFNLKSAYNSLDRNPSMPVQVFKYVWKWNGPERIRYLLWLVTNEAILTNATRARRHMTNIVNCPRCNAEEETTIHVFRDCQFARKVWSSLVPQDHLNEFFNTDLPEWILLNLSQRGNWPCTFGMGISALWYDRNKLVFEGKISAPGTVAISIHKRTTEVLNCLRKNLIKEQPNRSDHLIRWIPPPESIIKINVDGSFYSHNNNAACGGVFRDQGDRFLKGFSCNLGSCSIMLAELWAVIKGLQIATANDIHHVIIESDSKMALNFVRNGCLDSHPCATLIKDINILAGRIPSIKWNHIFREANTVADCLAKKGTSFPTDCTFLMHHHLILFIFCFLIIMVAFE